MFVSGRHRTVIVVNVVAMIYRFIIPRERLPFLLIRRSLDHILLILTYCLTPTRADVRCRPVRRMSAVPREHCLRVTQLGSVQ